MTIVAKVEALFPTLDRNQYKQLYRDLELKMQQMGHLVPYREQLNWTQVIEDRELGDQQTLQQLKTAAAKNDHVFLFYAKWFKKTVYQHLIIHPNEEGFYLPFRFDEPFYLHVHGRKLWVGSSVRLADELGWLELTMNDYEPNHPVKLYWQNFRDVCEKSITKNSPLLLTKGNG
ncbi:hypothetical protein [Desertibacillus haloalkaliphilus]|uniref:hypothetical protein n=1 Tax=Desertibacillus haloalkaliphilus TaxID=1328930 RepID=UPI001C260A84|nr:hypothetical protein [Desertibacillus haloalkaliphilus]MBU8907451.1 hypothetical protein [Desertibacillus haloalkaliphilus]